VLRKAKGNCGANRSANSGGLHRRTFNSAFVSDWFERQVTRALFEARSLERSMGGHVGGILLSACPSVLLHATGPRA
jgi:hypothetical protein